MTEGQAVKGNNGGNHAVIQNSGSPIFLKEDPLILFREGQYRHVPMMAGVTKHEGSFFLGSKLHSLIITEILMQIMIYVFN